MIIVDIDVLDGLGVVQVVVNDFITLHRLMRYTKDAEKLLDAQESIRQAERERCALLCEVTSESGIFLQTRTGRECAKEIRALKDR